MRASGRVSRQHAHHAPGRHHPAGRHALAGPAGGVEAHAEDEGGRHREAHVARARARERVHAAARLQGHDEDAHRHERQHGPQQRRGRLAAEHRQGGRDGALRGDDGRRDRHLAAAEGRVVEDHAQRVAKAGQGQPAHVAQRDRLAGLVQDQQRQRRQQTDEDDQGGRRPGSQDAAGTGRGERWPAAQASAVTRPATTAITRSRGRGVTRRWSCRGSVRQVPSPQPRVARRARGRDDVRFRAWLPFRVPRGPRHGASERSSLSLLLALAAVLPATRDRPRAGDAGHHPHPGLVGAGGRPQPLPVQPGRSAGRSARRAGRLGAPALLRRRRRPGGDRLRSRCALPVGHRGRPRPVRRRRRLPGRGPLGHALRRHVPGWTPGDRPRRLRRPGDDEHACHRRPRPACGFADRRRRGRRPLGHLLGPGARAAVLRAVHRRRGRGRPAGHHRLRDPGVLPVGHLRAHHRDGQGRRLAAPRGHRRPGRAVRHAGRRRRAPAAPLRGGLAPAGPLDGGLGPRHGALRRGRRRRRARARQVRGRHRRRGAGGRAGRPVTRPTARRTGPRAGPHRSRAALPAIGRRRDPPRPARVARMAP